MTDRVADLIFAVSLSAHLLPLVCRLLQVLFSFRTIIVVRKLWACRDLDKNSFESKDQNFSIYYLEHLMSRDFREKNPSECAQYVL